MSEETSWLIARELPRLRRFARALRPDSGADDLVQDCLERALRKSNLWRHGTNMRAWLFRILYNVHLSGLRNARRSPFTLPLDEIDQPVSDRGQQFARVELAELSKALGDLPVEQRDVILLVALEGMRYDEAAEVLGISMGTVRSRLSRGRAALRAGAYGSAAVRADGTERVPRLRRVK